MEHLEIERKYLIRMPEESILASLPRSEIEQIYILGDGGGRERVRRRVYADRTVYTHTAKKRLSEISRVEAEEEIGEEEFRAFLTKTDPSRRPIRKTRYLYDYQGQLFEIDVFPFWSEYALMELEMESEEQKVCLPPDIPVVREVTSDGRFTNSAMAREVPRIKLENEV